MPLTIGQLAIEAMQLSVSSRAELAERLVESLDLSEGGEAQRQWAGEALRRRNDVRSGVVRTIPGEQVFTEVRRMLKE